MQIDAEVLSRDPEILGGAPVFTGTRVPVQHLIDYLPPAEYWEGDPEARKQERREKLERGRLRRAKINRQRLQMAA